MTNISTTGASPMTLDVLESGHRAVVRTVGGEGALRQHFLDMGVIPGARMEFVKTAPLGDPLEYRIHGYELTLRREDAAKIGIELVDEADWMEGRRFETDASEEEINNWAAEMLDAAIG